MKISGRIFNQALPRGSQWMDIELNAPVEALLELVEKRLARKRNKCQSSENMLPRCEAVSPDGFRCTKLKGHKNRHECSVVEKFRVAFWPKN